jgi:hypothetical protein
VILPNGLDVGELVTVPDPPRALRLGPQRRLRIKRSVLASLGASRAVGGGPQVLCGPSLDISKELIQTSVLDLLISCENERQKFSKVEYAHQVLSDSLDSIRLDDLLAGDPDAAWESSKHFARVAGCGSQFVGFRAACCGADTAPVAIAICCNDRCCPKCCAKRSRSQRRKIACMFERLAHPALLTLTVPNTSAIRKHGYKRFRQQVRRLLKYWQTCVDPETWDKAPKDRKTFHFIKGGLYSLETTYNRDAQSWHVHCHVLADCATALYTPSERFDWLGKKNVHKFTAVKMRMEWDWTRLWVTGMGNKGWIDGKRARRDAGKDAREHEEYEFAEWVRGCRVHSNVFAKKWSKSHKKLVLRSDLTQAERARYEVNEAWNARYRRSIFISPVRDVAGAVSEVLKYITKASDFADLPEVLREFYRETKGARMVQTFGSWYGWNPEDQPEGISGELKQRDCACGQRDWKRLGVFFRSDVVMGIDDGLWYMTREHNHLSLGECTRPTIPRLVTREKQTGELRLDERINERERESAISEIVESEQQWERAREWRVKVATW